GTKLCYSATALFGSAVGNPLVRLSPSCTPGRVAAVHCIEPRTLSGRQWGRVVTVGIRVVRRPRCPDAAGLALARISHATDRWTAIRDLKRLADAVLAVLTSLGLRVVAQGGS